MTSLDIAKIRRKRSKIHKQFIAFLKKEFHHVFRDRKTLLIMFIMPIVQILLFGFAMTNELKNAKVVFVNANSNHETMAIADKISNSKFFSLVANESTALPIETYFKRNIARAAVVFPDKFDERRSIQVIVDGSDPNTSKTIVNYLNAIILDYQMHSQRSEIQIPFNIEVKNTMLYNPTLNGSMMFIPGVIAIVMMLICTTLTAVSVVREKEFGSIEVLLVSPLKPLLVLIAKAIPFLIVSFVNLCLILFLSYYLMEVPLRGSVLLLLFESMLFILVCLSIGLVISNVAKNQATAMLMSMMGMFLPMLLFTGALFPIENMPIGYQWFSNIIPSRWYYTICIDIMMKGSGLKDLIKETTVLMGMTLSLLTISMLKFKRNLE